MTLSVEGN